MAKDDNLNAADSQKDKKNQDEDEQLDQEKEKINEQGDEVHFRNEKTGTEPVQTVTVF